MRGGRKIFLCERQAWRAAISDFGNQLGWAAAVPQHFEVTNHVHLVVIAKAVRDIQPGPLWSRNLGIQSSLKTGNPSKSFWRRTCLATKLSFELPHSYRALIGKIRYSHRSMM